MIYSAFRYLFPPRPATKSPASAIPTYERMGMWAQPKLNGSCALLFTNGEETVFMNRHQERFARELISREELATLHRGEGWMVLVGEYMNKSQRQKDRKVFNSKFVVFDILVYEGKYLVNTTLRERQELLRKLYPTVEFDSWIDKISETFYLVKNITKDFASSWKDITSIEMYEGFVLKKPEGKLATGFQMGNNTGWQLKIRKETKNYQY
jgi:ATP-dependent DNA ligase